MYKIWMYFPFFIIFTFLSIKLSYPEFSEFILLSSTIIYLGILSQIGFSCDDRKSTSNIYLQTEKRLTRTSQYQKINPADIWEISYYSFYLSTIVVSLIGGVLTYVYFLNYSVSAVTGWTIFIVSQTFYLEKQMKFLNLGQIRFFITYSLPSILFIMSLLFSKKNLYANTAEFNISIFSVTFLFVNLTQFIILKLQTPKIKINRNRKLRKKIFISLFKSRLLLAKSDLIFPTFLYAFILGNIFLTQKVDSVFVLCISLALVGLLYPFEKFLKLKITIFTLLLLSLYFFIGGFQILSQYYSNDIYLTSFFILSFFILQKYLDIKMKDIEKMDYIILGASLLILAPTLNHYGTIITLYVLLARSKYKKWSRSSTS